MPRFKSLEAISILNYQEFNQDMNFVFGFN